MSAIPHRSRSWKARAFFSLITASCVIASAYFFTAAVCAENAAGQTIRSGDLDAIAIWIYLLGLHLMVGLVVSRPGGSVLRRTVQGIAAAIGGGVFMFVLGMIVHSSIDASSATCVAHFG